MDHYDLVVRGAVVANSDGSSIADVGVAAGVVREVAAHITARGDVELAGHGKILVPGGIDPHTHFATPSPDGTLVSADDYETGTRAAAAGGVTTIINYAFQRRGESLAETLRREHAKARDNAIVDYSFHPVVTDLRGGLSLAELPELATSGIASIKIFTAYEPFRVTDREAIQLFAACGPLGVLVNVHAEDDALIEFITSRFDESGDGAADVLDELQQSRPDVAEALAIERAAIYAAAAGCSVYFVHLSSRAALEAVRRARSGGGPVFAEVRPAYLMLDRGLYAGADGYAFTCLPPLRTPIDQEALWEGIAAGDIDTAASDHTAYRRAEKNRTLTSLKDIVPGFGGVQETCGLLYSYGVATGRITREQFVAVTSTNAAKIFGLWPHKGRIAPGFDADLVLIDPSADVTIGPRMLESASDYSPFSGVVAAAWPEVTIASGEVIYQRGDVLGRPGRGRYLQRITTVHAPVD